MARQYNNTDCPLHGSRYCSILNMVSCEECTITAREKTTGVESVKSYIDALDALMPEGGLADLFSGNTCVLCKSDTPNAKSGYALLDMGNTQPDSTKRNVLGIKVKMRAGAVVPVQLACCEECRKRFLRVEYVRLIVMALCVGLMVLLLSVRPIFEGIKSIWMGLPAVLFLAAAVLGWVISTLVRAKLAKRYSKLTHLNVFELPKLNEMHEKGWFQLGENSGKLFTKLVFTKKRIRQGVYTGTMQQ